jgi:hypothetical protein
MPMTDCGPASVVVVRAAGRAHRVDFAAYVTADESNATLVVQCERAGDTVPSLSENES